MSTKFMARQGDILIKETENYNANNCIKMERDEQDRIVLAYGESTGHAHAIKDKNAILMRDKDTNKIYLIILHNTADLIHEEHSTITLPSGLYEVKRQRQYTPEEIQYVAD